MSISGATNTHTHSRRGGVLRIAVPWNRDELFFALIRTGEGHALDTLICSPRAAPNTQEKKTALHTYIVAWVSL